MLPKLSLIVVIFLFMQTSSSRGTSPSSRTLLMQLGMVRDNVVADGLMESGSLVVHGDGGYRFEQRRQRMPSTTNDLKVYEGKLEEGQLNELVAILNNPQVEALPDYVPPHFPVSTSKVEMLTVEFNVNGARRHVGYFRWVGATTSGASPEDTPDNVKKDWRTSRSVLQLLASWFGRFENGSLKRVAR
jgi:hypothetical protein